MTTKKHGNYEWDENKNISNKKKHGVSFNEAVTAFFDNHALIIDDPQEHEDRFVLMGMSDKARVLYVIHAESINRKRTRIISARIATKSEALQYTLGDAA